MNQHPANGGGITIHNHVPFADPLYWYLRLEGLGLADLAGKHRYDKSYLAWETVRRSTNPFFEKGTGFEGYFVGRTDLPEEVLEELLKLGHDSLDNLAHQYRFEYGFRNKLMKTLAGESYNLPAVNFWATWLGAMLARLRAQVYRSMQATAFHNDTYQQVNLLPLIKFQENASLHAIEQQYRIGSARKNNHQKIAVSGANLRTSDREAWRLVSSIGKFGHPLVRELLQRAPYSGHLLGASG